MSDNDNFDTETGKRHATAPYTSRHPVPNIQRYEEQQERRQKLNDADSVQETAEQTGDRQLYKSENHNVEQPAPGDGDPNQQDRETNAHAGHSDEKRDTTTDTQQAVDNERDPKRKRKNMKHRKADGGSRQVTDPVTHLPVTIHDSTEQELKNAPDNEPPYGSSPRTSTKTVKSKSELQDDEEEEEAEHQGMQKLFPPPQYQPIKEGMSKIYGRAAAIGLCVSALTSLGIFFLSHLITAAGPKSQLALIFSRFIIPIAGLATGGIFIWAVQGWIHRKIDSLWDDELWEASKEREQQLVGSPTPESTQWLNSILASVWPLINPDLFTSLADTLEDVMQASLPKMVRMISVEDLGQGSEAIRILGVRWLPTGAASKSIDVDGNIKSDKNADSDRRAPGEGEMQDDAKPQEQNDKGKPSQEEEADDQNIAEGMECEEGDFVNVEVAFAYRASSSGRGLKRKVKNAHLFLAFYLPGGIKFPVWVELVGIVGTMRMRLQLCPDPPFFALCTLTLLGQPKANLSCVPLTKRGLNIMDLPIISTFVQSSIDAALAEYVAPKSLTLDIKGMITGNDFKEDTLARGVIVVRIKRATNFKEGDGGIVGIKPGSSDPYVSVGWAKFGKSVWSTRIIFADMEPVWEETAFILVTADELNADERLQLQLWDSDRGTADDELGKIEVDLKEIMHDKRSKQRMWDREDSFMGMEAGEKMPGTLQWSVGYYPKVNIQEDQLARQTAESDVKNIDQLKEKVSKEEGEKLREATDRDVSSEIELQKAKDLKAREDNLVISSPPPESYLSGILSVEVHNITGLQYKSLNKETGEGGEGDDMEEGDRDLPSSYCTVLLNHKKIFKTRTKPKNSKPFFNAATERMVRNWQDTEVMISVRDARVHEDDPLLGIVYLPLGQIFHDCSQKMEDYPLIGGIAYGRIRISMVFRSVALKLPKELLGWDYGTLEVIGSVTSEDVPPDLKGLRIKLRTSVNRGKMYPSGREGEWEPKKDRNVRLAVRNRYCSPVVMEFRKSRIALDKTPAFAILWLKDIPDDEETTVTLPIWQGDFDLKRAESNCLESMGTKVGSIKICLKLWHGLSSYHKPLTKNNPSLRDVFEVLDTASDSKEIQEAMEGSSDSDSSDEDPIKLINPATTLDKVVDKLASHNHDQEKDSSRGPLESIKDYKDHRKQLHRQHRGIMQYKVSRYVYCG
jgi:Ca2+-dependent lipid-binding protein